MTYYIDGQFAVPMLSKKKESQIVFYLRERFVYCFKLGLCSVSQR